MSVSIGLAGCGVESVEPIDSIDDEPRSIELIPCGGFAGTPCPPGLVCVDDPGDDCDPEAGGADCIGICVEPEPVECDYDDPDRDYVSESPRQCAVIRFLCAEGTHPFFDECGCGCEVDDY